MGNGRSSNTIIHDPLPSRKIYISPQITEIAVLQVLYSRTPSEKIALGSNRRICVSIRSVVHFEENCVLGCKIHSHDRS